VRIFSKRNLQTEELDAAIHCPSEHVGRSEAVKKANIELNRKVLADLAMNHPEAFKAIVDKVK